MDDKYWKFIIDAANSIRKVLNNKPQALKIGYHLSPNGILSAYREGDLNYNEACDILEKLIRKTPNTKEDLQNDIQQLKTEISAVADKLDNDTQWQGEHVDAINEAVASMRKLSAV